MNKWRNTMMIYFHFSQEAAEKGVSEGRKEGRNTAGCLCFGAELWGSPRGAEWSSCHCCWAMEKEQRKSELCFTGKDRTTAAPRAPCMVLSAAREGKPFNIQSLSPVLCLFSNTITEPKGVVQALHRSQVCISAHWAWRKGRYWLGFLGVLAGKGGCLARVLLSLAWWSWSFKGQLLPRTPPSLYADTDTTLCGHTCS